MKIEFDISVQCFKKGKKEMVDYEFPRAVFAGTIKLTEKDKPTDFLLESKDKQLLVRMRWDSATDKVFCLTRPKKLKDSVSFDLFTKVPGGGNISSYNIGGRNFATGRFTNWSANMKILSRA